MEVDQQKDTNKAPGVKIPCTMIGMHYIMHLMTYNAKKVELPK